MTGEQADQRLWKGKKEAGQAVLGFLLFFMVVWFAMSGRHLFHLMNAYAAFAFAGCFPVFALLIPRALNLNKFSRHCVSALLFITPILAIGAMLANTQSKRGGADFATYTVCVIPFIIYFWKSNFAPKFALKLATLLLPIIMILAHFTPQGWAVILYAVSCNYGWSTGECL